MSELVKIEYPYPQVALITLNDPSHMNAFSPAILEELNAAITMVDGSPTVNVGVITGSGKAFVAGADIKYMNNLTPDQALMYARNTTSIYNKMERSRKVFIAAVNGYALGAGFELTMACDLRVASEYAKFGLPETGIGIIPGGHGTQKLPRHAGIAKTKEMVFTGKPIRAQEAFELGIINRVTAPETLVQEAVEIAVTIAEGPTTAIGYAKEVINLSGTLDEASGYAYEEKMFSLCFATDEQKEGMKAFIEKRKPDFKNI